MAFLLADVLHIISTHLSVSILQCHFPEKNVTAFPWVQCFIQIGRSILFSPEGKNFCLKLWVLLDSKCRFNFFSLYLFLFLLLPKTLLLCWWGVIACGTPRKLWLYALFEPLFELLKWIKWTAYLGKLVPVNFLAACFFNTAQYFKTQSFSLAIRLASHPDFHLWFRIYVFIKHGQSSTCSKWSYL